MRTFSCNFGGGVTCTFKVDDEPPGEGERHFRDMVWTGQRKQKHFRPYVHWMNGVTKQLRDEWDVEITFVYQIRPGELEVWFFKPGKSPKRITARDAGWPKDL